MLYIYKQAGEESKDACVQWLLHYHSLGDLDIFLEQMIENIPQNMTVNFTCIIQNANFFIQFAESVKELTDSKQTRIAEIILDSIEKLLPVNVDSSAKHSKKRKRSRKEQTVTPYLEWLVSLFSWAKAGFNHSILADVDEKLKRICELARHILGIDRSDVAAWLVLSNVCEWASYKDLVQPDMQNTPCLLTWKITNLFFKLARIKLMTKISVYNYPADGSRN
jgi:hypothetical protein